MMRLRQSRLLIRYAIIGLAIGFHPIVAPWTASAQSPAQEEDTRAEQQRLMRAVDQIELMQQQAETRQNEFTTLQSQVAELKQTVAGLKQEAAALRAALTANEAARAREREALLSEVSRLVADNASRKAPKAPAPKAPTAELNGEAPASKTPAATERGYTYTVEAGQTLSAIAAAYQEQGVKVTVEDIRKANHLGKDAKLKVGQKLFIPKK